MAEPILGLALGLAVGVSVGVLLAAPTRGAWLKAAAFVGLSALLLLAAWQFWPSSAPARVDDFGASSTSIAQGEEVMLSWSTSGTDSVELTPQGAVAVSGSTAVSPAEDTDYVLTAYGAGGSDARTIRIEVTSAPVQPTPEPVIEVFRGDATSIMEGEEVTLTWSTSEALRAELRTGDPVALRGSTSVSPQQTTDYTLVAAGPGGEARRSIRVSVESSTPVAPTARLSAEPGTIELGGSTTLSWSTTNVSSVWLEGVGPVEANGSRQMTPTGSVIYRLLVTGTGGTIRREAGVMVAASTTPTPPPEDLLNRAVWIEGGTFYMGSDEGDPDEQPVHRVMMSGFWMQEHEVTNEEYRRFDPEHQFPAGQERHPVAQVNWQQAVDYAASRGGSLPTEAQWEFASRGAQGRAYPWGEATPTCQLAQHEGCDPGGTLPVMSWPDGATPAGVHDLAGNVWEWVLDWYGPYEPGGALDPTGAPSGSSRLMRGGAYSSRPTLLRGPYRLGVYPGVAFDFVGVRVVWARTPSSRPRLPRREEPSGHDPPAASPDPEAAESRRAPTRF